MLSIDLLMFLYYKMKKIYFPFFLISTKCCKSSPVNIFEYKQNPTTNTRLSSFNLTFSIKFILVCKIDIWWNITTKGLILDLLHNIFWQKLYIAYPLPFIEIFVHKDRNKNHDLPKCQFFKSVTGWLIFLDAIFN